MAMRRPKIRSDQTKSSEPYTSIPDFYRDKAVLVTGATGFLGQGLVEKLLRSCPNIGKIYIPIRHNKNGDTEQRYKQFLANKVFSELKKTNPDFGDKIVPFHSDIRVENMGMDSETYVAITRDVSVIFHCAADIRLNPSLRESVEGNIIGSKNVFEFGKKCQNLCAYLHVSTTFSNYNLNHVEEKVYPAVMPPEEAIALLRHHDDDYVRAIEKEASDESVYAACKMVAESILIENDHSEKSAVFRPCFISPALSEPYKGWSHGYGGYCGVLPHIINERTVNSSFHDGRERLNIIPNRFQYFLVLFIQYLLPAILLDVLLVFSRERPKYTKLLLRMRKLMKYLEKTTFRCPTYDFNNAKMIHGQLSESDQTIFPFDVSSIRWKEFLHTWVENLKADSKNV